MSSVAAAALVGTTAAGSLDAPTNGSRLTNPVPKQALKWRQA